VDGTPVADPKAKRSSEPTEPVTLTVMTPSEQGFGDLLDNYRQEHPNVTVRIQQTDGPAYYQKLRTMLAAGEPPDVVLLGDEYRAEYFNDPDLLADLGEVGPDVDQKQWLDWKYKGGLGADGTLRGYGLDISPYGMAYRTDLFAAAGLPTDPAQVGELFKTWDGYFAAGDQYVQQAGKPWFDSSAEVYTAMQNQVPSPYFTESGQLTIDNTAIKDAWTAVTGAAGRGQSAKLEPFGPDWLAGFRAAAFATVPAPYWMLPLIKSSSGPENAGKWAIAGVFPDGGANWGGSYLSVPAQSRHPEQAARLAAWLTSPDQGKAPFTTANTLPAQESALTTSEVTGTNDDYFVSKGTGSLYAGLAHEVPFAPYASPLDSRVQTEAVWPALAAVEQGTPPDAGWQQAVARAGEIAAG
jgi:cellobiose transport system substrate-binding protein